MTTQNAPQQLGWDPVAEVVLYARGMEAVDHSQENIPSCLSYKIRKSLPLFVVSHLGVGRTPHILRMLE